VEAVPAWLLIGEAVETRKARPEPGSWLAPLARELGQLPGERAILPFEDVGGCVLGALASGSDPLRPVLEAALAETRRPMRWAIVLASLEVPADAARSEPALVRARSALALARSGRERLLIQTGEAESDALLAAMAPALVELLDGLTPRQRTVARLALLEGLRQVDVADRLGVRRATVSVSFARARILPLGRLIGAIGSACSAAAAKLDLALRPGTKPDSSTREPAGDAASPTLVP